MLKIYLSTIIMNKKDQLVPRVFYISKLSFGKKMIDEKFFSDKMKATSTKNIVSHLIQ